MILLRKTLAQPFQPPSTVATAPLRRLIEYTDHLVILRPQVVNVWIRSGPSSLRFDFLNMSVTQMRVSGSNEVPTLLVAKFGQARLVAL